MNRPDYLDVPGDLVFRAPFLCQGTKFHGFVLKVKDMKALRGFCDQYLNRASDQVRYHPVIPYVMLGFADIAVGTSELDRDKGFVHEIDVCFWIPLVGVGPDGRAHPVWAVPFLFVNSVYAMAMGREAFGFRKTLGTMSLPADFPSTRSFRVDSEVLPHFDPRTASEVRTVLQVEGPGQGFEALSEFDSAEELGEHILASLPEAQAPVAVSGAAEPVDVVRAFSSKGVPLVFLKQFRDAVEPGKACYRAIVEAPAFVTGFQGAGLLPAGFKLSIEDFDSHPMRRSLGLPPGPQKATVGCWMRFDFKMSFGREVGITQESRLVAPTP